MVRMVSGAPFTPTKVPFTFRPVDASASMIDATELCLFKAEENWKRRFI